MSFGPLRPIHRLSLRNKLRAIILLTVAAVLLPACVLLGIADIATTCDAMRTQLANRAGFVGQNSAAALSFGDAASAAETLRSLRSYPSVRAACIYSVAASVCAVPSRRRGGCVHPSAAPARRGRLLKRVA